MHLIKRNLEKAAWYCAILCTCDLKAVRVELINTGSELLVGRVLNAHQQWLGQQLSDAVMSPAISKLSRIQMQFRLRCVGLLIGASW